MARTRARSRCASCGFATTLPLGRCPECGAWDSFEPEAPAPAPGGGAGASPAAPARPVGELTAAPTPRLLTGIGELDRVLGGGVVPGAVVLLGGDPGVGKSTLLLHALDALARAGHRVLYASAEESAEQTALRARRLGVAAPGLMVLCEGRLQAVLAEADRLGPRVLAVDSVQVMAAADVPSAPGTPTQVRAVAAALTAYAKPRGLAVVLVGHVTKDGGLAGPKTLEHLVDAVLHFEGDPRSACRILRASKNRFGCTDEIGVFEMGAAGLREVADPSALFLAERPRGAPGSAVVASLEGARPLLVEVQALTAHAAGPPRRTALGIDPYRVALMLAVLERHAGLDAGQLDVFVNVAGGLTLDEPAVDLALVAALASAATGRPVPAEIACFGEVGLAGEIRAVPRVDLRLAEAARRGFRRAVVPPGGAAAAPGLELVRVADVGAALTALLGPAPARVARGSG
ncbi:MAG TPA: DNA repair protein RadA [Polyangia bacterium]|jgi:DNA repair protein RadA/Sms